MKIRKARIGIQIEQHVKEMEKELCSRVQLLILTRLVLSVDVLAHITMIKHLAGWHTHRNLFSHSSTGRNFETRV